MTVNRPQEQSYLREEPCIHGVIIGRCEQCEAKSSKERFLTSTLLLVYDGKKYPVAESDEHLVSIKEADLDIEQAIQLRDWLNAVLSASETPARIEGPFVVADGGGQGEHRYRCWQDDGPRWTLDMDEALQFARRKDAESFARDDKDAWCILPVPRSAVETL